MHNYDLMVVTFSSRGSKNNNSPLRCPRCQGERIFRIFPLWSRMKGLEMFECSVCGKKFYRRNVDDYRPSFENRW
ncbi:MAG: hypothetical protein EAX81_08300 [Candidatus Thorarchaeota archaeon]|nr:hypothetical protein [Candidatus Thorarchaeota archaeon]